MEQADSGSVTEVWGDCLTGWVVVDSLDHDTALGGTRMTANVTLSEVQRLARGMTEKLSLVRLPIGGAKAGIVSGRDRCTTLREFGRLVGPILRGGVHLGCDMGITLRQTVQLSQKRPTTTFGATFRGTDLTLVGRSTGHRSQPSPAGALPPRPLQRWPASA